MADMPITIKGGSLVIETTQAQLKEQPAEERGNWRYIHPHRAGDIVCVEILDRNTGQRVIYTAPSNGEVTIMIHYDVPD